MKESQYNAWLHRFSILTAAVAICLVVAGATVTSTGSGDAVPDWPLSYGTLTPPMIGGILYEHTHRLIAGLTGILIAVLALWIWRTENRRSVRWMGAAALLAVIVQATLGGLRVLVVSTKSVQLTATEITGVAAIEPIRIGIAVTHGVLAQTIICLLFAIVVFTSKSWIQFKPVLSPDSLGRKGGWLSISLVALVFLQLLLGTLIRHTGAGLIIPDFPLSFGKIIPPFGNLPYDPHAPFPISREALLFKVALQFSHRLLAFVILGWIIYLFIRYRKTGRTGNLVDLLLGLTVLQILLGAINIWSHKSVYSTIPHVALGALILAGSVVLSLWALRAGRAERETAADGIRPFQSGP